MPTFDPQRLELMQRGTTAALLLDVQTELCGQCVEAVLRRIDQAVDNDTVTSERAVQWIAEIAAFRRIVHRHSQVVNQGRAAQARLMEETAGNG